MPNTDLDAFIIPSLVWLASELQMDVNEDDDIPVVVGQLEYPLPRNLAWMVWVEFNGSLLKPTSTYAMNLNTTNVSTGTVDWRSAANGTPVQFAIEGRNLIMNPPASTASTMRWRWIGSADEGFQVSGTPMLSDMDQQLVRYSSAIGWLSAHPSQDNILRIQSYTAEINRLLPAAKQRWNNPSLSFYPSFSPDLAKVKSPITVTWWCKLGELLETLTSSRGQSAAKPLKEGKVQRLPEYRQELPAPHSGRRDSPCAAKVATT